MTTNVIPIRKATPPVVLSGPVSAAAKHLIAAGVTGDALVTALAEIEAASKPSRSKGAERTARWRERYSDVTCDDKKEIPHTPLEKTNNINYISAREAEKPAEKPPVSRGSRLPENFLPLPNVIEMARNLGFSDSEIKFEIAQFTDHWRAASGANAVKRDWNAALRNWFRNALKFKHRSTSRQTTGDKWRDGIAAAGRVSRGEGLPVDQDLP